MTITLLILAAVALQLVKRPLRQRASCIDGSLAGLAAAVGYMLVSLAALAASFWGMARGALWILNGTCF